MPYKQIKIFRQQTNESNDEYTDRVNDFLLEVNEPEIKKFVSPTGFITIIITMNVGIGVSTK